LRQCEYNHNIFLVLLLSPSRLGADKTINLKDMSMNNTIRMKISNLGLLLAGTVSGKVLAGDAGSIIYAPGALPAPPPVVADAIQVPTLGGAALMVLSFVLAVVAVRIIKSQKASGTNLVAIVTAATSLIVGAGGISLVSTPLEATEVTIFMTAEDGGVLTLSNTNTAYSAVNNTSKTMTISAINVTDSDNCMVGEQPVNGGTVTNGGLNGGALVGDCAVDMDIEPGDFCEIIITCIQPQPV
jgi:exosortase sorting signal-containing protein